MTEVSAHSAGDEEVPRFWPFNATEKLDPDVRELLSMHCSWCVLGCGEAQWFTKGDALSALERKEEAVVCYGRALEIEPRDARAWYNKGHALSVLGRKQE